MKRIPDTFEQSFASSDKARFWSDKNNVKPRDVFKSSSKKYLFDCECGHENEQQISNITQGCRCGYCSNKKLCNKPDCKSCFEKSFASNDKAVFWSDKNEVKPRDVFKYSNKKYLFQCECGHEIEQSLNNIISGKWCGYCRGDKLCSESRCKFCFEKSFASSDKAKYWSDKNEVKPRDVCKSSHNTYLFECNCDHDIVLSLGKITTGQWCGYCSNPPKKLCDKQDCKFCFEKSFASNDKSIFWSDKNDVKPRNVFKSTSNRYLFDCVCGHEIDQSLNSITSGQWCGYCGCKKLCHEPRCKFCHEKSFASSEQSKYWSDKNEVKPRDVFKYSNNTYLFNCVCGHEIKQMLCDIIPFGVCGYCKGDKLCSNTSCKFCFEKSFASSDKAKYWSDKNEVKPRDFCKSSSKKYLFDCVCGHEIDQSLHTITSGYWCGYCGRKKLCDKQYCKFCFALSFASSDKAKYWSDKNEVKPRDVFKSTPNKYFFNCKKGHHFDQSLSNITSGKWCRYCINKTEQKVYEKLITYFPTLEQQFKVEWCKNKTYLPFDFVIELYNIIIELDGPQHFIQISNWSSPEEQHNNDKYKMECANKNGYSVIRLTQEDVFYDTYDWLSELVTNINWIIESKNKLNIFMGLNDEYSPFLVK
jgi:very-short-patch-repair endonuclease